MTLDRPTRREAASPRETDVRNEVTLVQGDVPVEGLVREPFRWDDVLREPRPEHPGPAAYCVPAPDVSAGGERIEAAVLARLDGSRLHLEHRLGVQRRVLADVVAATPPRMRRFTAIPDRLRKHAGKAREFLSTPSGRARFRQGLRDPRALTGEQKAITLFTVTAALLGAILVAHLAVTLATPERAGTWRTMLALFFYGYLGSFGVPLPWEPVLIPAALLLGAIPTLVVAVASKVAAGYMVFFVGDAVNAKLEARAQRSPAFARFLAWSERFATRYGFFAMALFIATPGLPDAVALYVFGSLRMPMWKYLGGLAVGAAVLDVAILYGIGRLFGIG